MSYDPDKIEKKWQTAWEKAGLFEVKKDKTKEKFYGLIEFPYPSGEGLHVGHLRSNTALDIICRKKRMEGKNVLFPIGFDSFGLPTENYAVKTKTNPSEVTKTNIKTFTRQLKELGFSFDWSRAFSTSDPNYYKWTQWIFTKLFEKGLAYKAKKEINWCPSCKIGLANEEVVSGTCERCGKEVIKKEKEQWILKITEYADRLIKDLDQVDYLDQIKEQQLNWIGKSEGALINFKVNNDNLEVFTTRPDTIYGATFMVVSPEHELIEKNKDIISNFDKIKAYVKEAKKKGDKEEKKKTGIEIKGLKAINPATKKEIPIFVADYVSIDYGTGAIMAVPAHDERDFAFAKKYDLPIVQVIKPEEILDHPANPAAGIWGKQDVDIETECWQGEGKNINSGKLNGLKTEEAIKQATKLFGKKSINYHLRDWIFSRQRYWGEPIPMIYCDKCGWQVVPEKDLPVKLPELKDFMPTKTGESPLSKIDNFVKTRCPKCGGEAKRETDVMPNWAGSNWYFLRYCDPKSSKSLADQSKLEYWLPVDWYNGGMEHTTLHLLYSRFIYKFLYDIGAVPKKLGPEPYKKRTTHGMILGEGGVKMSKSKGNVINPDEYVKEYGADTIRIYEMFMGPFDQTIPWEGQNVIGVYRFLNRVWQLEEKIEKDFEDTETVLRELHQTIEKVSSDIETMKFNTAVSQLMSCLNILEKEKKISKEVFEKFITILSPFAPHITEELWQKMGNKGFVSNQNWPDYDKKLIKQKTFNLVVQVNGRLRDTIEIKTGISEEEAKDQALSSSKVLGWTQGKEIIKTIFIKDKLINFVVK